MNFKEEGFVVGEKAFLVTEYMSDMRTFEDADIVYVGAKNIKVMVKDKVLLFNGTNYLSDKFSFGKCYKVYRSKEHYEEVLKNIALKLALKGEIQASLKSLPLDKLLKIRNIIEE